jgi:hypothetical protein
LARLNERVDDKARNFEREGQLARVDPSPRLGKTLRSTLAHVSYVDEASS